MAATKKTAPKLSKDQQATLDGLTQMAGKIRYLLGEGFDRGAVSRILNIRYQWVRNVAITPLKS